MRHGLKAALWPVLSFLLFSCSLFTAKIPGTPSGVEFPLTEALRVSYEGRIIPSVRSGEGKIYLATDKGVLYCLDKEGKSVLWQFAAPVPFGCAPVLSPDQIWIRDQSNTLYGLDLEGRLLIKADVDEPIASPLVWHQGRVYFGTEDGNLLAFDREAQSLVRLFKTAGPLETPPVFTGRVILVAGSEGRLYALNLEGRVLRKSDVLGRIRVPPLVDEGLIYFGSEEKYFYSLRVTDLEREWRVRIGGKVVVPPRPVGKRVIFIASNNVLYALAKKSGNIDWWRIIPGRSAYELEFDDKKIVVASRSSLLACYDGETGAEIGRYDAGEEIQSNPLWLDPYLLINLHDFAQGRGSLVFLEKEVRAELTASLVSPQPVGTEISFMVAAIGFKSPRFEFVLHSPDENGKVVQKESEKNSWLWYPEKPGIFRIEVRVSDGRQTRNAEIPFEIVERNS